MVHGRPRAVSDRDSEISQAKKSISWQDLVSNGGPGVDALRQLPLIGFSI